MSVINHQFFVVEIDKKAQEKKRGALSQSEKPYLGLKGYTAPNGGILVIGADADSPAEAAGFVSGDKITAIDDVELLTMEALIEYVYKKLPGDKVRLYYQSVLQKLVKEQPLLHKDLILGGKVPALFRSDLYIDMQQNLQYGVIRAIGKLANQELPEAEVGDLLIFNHKVEYKERTTGDVTFFDYHLIQVLSNGNELRIVDHAYEAYGVIKVSGEGPLICPHKKVIFCHSTFRQSPTQTIGGINLVDLGEKRIEDYEDKLEELKLQVEELSKSTILSAKTSERNYSRKEELFKQMQRIMEEKAQVAKDMNKRRVKELTVLFINPDSCDKLGHSIEPGDTLLANYDTLYPLDVLGVQYVLAYTDYAEILFTKSSHTNSPIMKALYNQVIVLPHVSKKVTAGGIHIADTAQKRSTTGDVISVGPGSEKFPMLMKAGDVVRYGQHAGTEFEQGGKQYVLLNAADVICVLEEGEIAEARSEVLQVTHKEEPPAPAAPSLIITP